MVLVSERQYERCVCCIESRSAAVDWGDPEGFQGGRVPKDQHAIEVTNHPLRRM
jgi:hypothetical protein